MKKIDDLRRQANVSAAAFSAHIDQTTDKLRPVKILDEIVGALDPDFAFLKQVRGRVRENPLALLAFASATMLLLRQVGMNAGLHSPTNDTAAKRSRLARTTDKGDNHDQHSNTK